MSLQEFHDRHEAGRLLAAQLGEFAGRGDVLVLALPRGGVAVGFEVAQALDAPLDVFVVRKLGVPGHEELAMGAIAAGGVCVMNREAVKLLRVPPDAIEAVRARETRELQRRESAYRGEASPPELRGKTVLLVDDGIATGATMRAAIAAAQAQEPARLVVAVPVLPREENARFRDEGTHVVALLIPENFHAVGAWYRSFTQTSDDEVRALLAAARDRRRAP